MTYRTGVYVVDRRTGRLGQLMGKEGPYVQLRPLGGGREWDCLPRALRLAPPDEIRQERAASAGSGDT
ncbi:hypothetical protein ACFP1Z_29920 [Streptomyces gamaensis]|uniref:Secreted protein n=1 Tax=Streptomyces gamaensis TaxID=1763542 RepID=A0ABW0Z6E0_9ACTN